MTHGAGAPVIAVDVGGTTIKAARIDAAGHAHPLPAIPTPIGADAVVQAVADAVARLREGDAAVEAVGVVVPGIVDAERGIGVFSENLLWRDAPLRDRISTATGLPVALDHDVRAAARAEQVRSDERDLAVLVVGTGIAAGLIVDGRLLEAGGMAGEIGHSIVVPDGPACVCGSHGCLEAIASAAGIVRAYRAATGEQLDGAAAVLARAQQGDVHAQRAWDSAVDAFAIALRQLVALVGSRTVAIAGGLSLAGDALLDPLRERVTATFSLQEVPELRIAQVGAVGGMLGAIDIARAAAAAEESA